MISFHPSPARRWLAAWTGCCGLLWLAGEAQGLEQVSLQLKWWHQFQFAGYYAAQARGFYQEEGLEVQIVEGGPTRAPLAAVVRGAAQYGVGDSDVVLARIKGQPVVACAAIFQHSPYVILSRRDRKIRSPADLIGARVMLSDDQGAAQLQAMLQREGIKPEQVKFEHHSWDLADLVAGRVDAVSAYAMVEPEQLRAQGVEPATLRALDYGVDFYGDTLFTHETELRAHPERVAALVRASLRGWAYALDHPEEIADLILKMDGVTARGATRQEMLRQAEGMREYILPNVVEIGHMNPGRWQHIARTFAEQGPGPAKFSLEGFLYDPNPPPDPALRRKLLALGLGGLAVAGLALLWTVQMRRQVRKRTAELQAALAEARRFRAALDEVPSFIYMKDAESRYFYANRPTLKLFGCSAEELAGSEDARFFPPETVKRLREVDLRVLAGEQTNEEVDVVDPDGGRRVYWEVKSPIFEESENKSIWGVLGISTDITARKKSEEAQRFSEARFASVFRSDLAGISITSLKTGRVIEVNERLCEFLGWPRDEAIGKTSLEMGIWVDQAQRESLVERVLATGSTRNEEAQLRCRNGEVRDVLLSMERVDIPGENAPALVTMFTDLTERKQAEAQLKLLETCVARLNDIVLITEAEPQDEPGPRIVFVNDAFIRRTGYTREEVIGKSPRFLQGPKTSRTELDRIHAAMNKWQPVRVELINYSKSGEEFWVELDIVPVANAVGWFTHWVAVERDITERKRTQEELQVSEGRYRALFEHAPDGIVIADSASTYIDANASICRMLGYSREELIGKSAADIVVPTEIPHVQSALRAIRAELPYHREWKFRRKDGSTFGAEVIATLLPDGNLLGMIRDITERRRTEERFRRLVESNAQGVMFFKTNGEITGANDAFLNLVGYSREDLEAGRLNWKAMTPPEHIEPCRRAMEEIATKGFFAPYEKEYFRKDGSRVPLLLGAASFEDAPEEGVAFAMDLTERNKLEQQYFRAQRMESIGTLAGGIAHDLNNVLSPIMMSLDLLKMKFIDAASEELLTIIGTSAARGADMVRQVLSFARGVEGQRIEVQIGCLLKEIEKITNETFLKHIRVRTDLAPDLWTVSGDPTQIHQVLLNFCVNARDAMPTAGTLTLSARNVMLDEQYTTSNPEAKPGPYVMITIEDNGIGMTPGVLEKIFDPFFTTKEVGKGTGLGLSTSLAIVKSHAGFIQAFSNPGVGTKFEIYLPAQTEASAASLAIPEAEMPRGHGEWILVIDDEAAVRSITQQTLEAFGYHVILAAGGAEAVNLFARQSTRIAAVVTDMMMPGIDGPATIQILRKMNPKLPIIAASGLATDEHIARAASLGVKHFLPKPFTAETLLKALRDILSAG